MLLGRDVLTALGLTIDFGDKQINWGNQSTPMVTMEDLSNRPKQIRDSLIERFVLFSDTEPDLHTSEEILSAKYNKVSTDEVADQSTHLNEEQRTDLKRLLRRFPALFSGKLGKYPHELVHIDIDPQAKPVHKRHYPVPRVHEQTFKEELDRLVELGVLEPCGRSEWAAPTFIIPKKDKTVRFVSDFRALNKVIKRRTFPMPRIHELLARRSGYKFFTKLDISMQYYTFQLDKESSELCTIATPFGLFRYLRLPMGVNQAPDIAQEVMEKVLQGLRDVEKYLDDVGCFSDTWKEHLTLLEAVLKRLEDSGFTINPSKCEWGVKETDWLGYWLTPTGLKPWPKKVQAIVDMKPPTNLKQLRSFLGLVTYYRTMWPRRSHMLAPLTNLVGKKSFQWGAPQQKAFEEMKAVAASDVLLRYPDHNKPFVIKTDASDYQLGAVILQDGVPVAYFSRKLNSAQVNYTTIEKELLSIVETLKTFRSMLLGARLQIHTDHKNLTHELTAFQTQRVLRWRLYLEEFGPEFLYLKGELNTVADALSRVPTARETSLVGESPVDVLKQQQDARQKEAQEAAVPMRHTHHDDNLHGVNDGHHDGGVLAHSIESTTNDHGERQIEELSIANEGYCLLRDEPELAECLLLHPEFDEQGRYPLSYSTIAEYQQEDATLMAAVQNQDATTIQYKQLGDVQIVVFQADERWRICIPSAILDRLILWYHLSMAHAGMTRLTTSIKQHFYHPKLKQRVEHLVGACDTCQRNKGGSRQYGELPARDVRVAPWYEVHVDLIGPWKVSVNGIDCYFRALTMIDPVTNLVEIVRYQDKSAYHIGRLFEDNWLSRYPRPMRLVADQGSEFKGAFGTILEHNGIEWHAASAKTPTANSICERCHLVIGNVLRTLVHAHPPEDLMDADDIIDQCLATAMHATRVVSSGALDNLSPGAVVFQRDMFLDIPLVADILAISVKREAIVNERLLQANRSRLTHDFKVDEQILKKVYDPNKLEERWIGPYSIEQVHVNGTVTIRLSPMVTDRVNIRRIKPYRQDV
ncbi:hypothetical protein MPSEU_000599900 [Mayamaea pseudoterrestris]|nr:hypothetical protein MPSEU_000599900 [Mayamaea pseudoterrestris]